MAAINKAYVSAISLIDKLNIYPSIVDVQNTYGLTDVAEVFGRMKPVDTPIYYNYSDRQLWRVGVSQGTITNNGTAEITVTLTAGTSGYGRQNDLVRFSDGAVGTVKTVTPGANDVLVITSIDGTNITHTLATNIVFFSNAVGEASDSRATINRGLDQKLNLIQTFRETYDITDIARNSAIYVQVDGKDYYYYKDRVEHLMKIRAEVNAAMLMGKLSSTKYSDSSPAFTDPVTSTPKQTTRGLDQYITAYGVNDTVASLGTFNAADLGAHIDKLKKLTSQVVILLPVLLLQSVNGTTTGKALVLLTYNQCA